MTEFPCENFFSNALTKAPQKIIEGVERREIVPNVFHLAYPSSAHAAIAFLRFQEHYESPEFRGKIFTLDQYKEWYSREKGSFSYYYDWSGFNIPSRVLTPFFDGQFSPLARPEEILLSFFENKRENLFYIIASSKSSKNLSPLAHEVAHGLYTTHESYRKEINAIVELTDHSDINEYLGSTGGYHPSVFDDETQACLIASHSGLLRAGIDMGKYERVVQKLQKIFERYVLAESKNSTSSLEEDEKF